MAATYKIPHIFKSFSDMVIQLPTDEACRLYLENVRWKGEPVCPHCSVKSKEHYKLKTKGEFRGLYKCKDCRERFTVTVGTMFHGSHASLRKWFIAIYIFTSHKKGISSLQLHRDLGVTQKTAWFMLHRIRETFSPKGDARQVFGVVQADETFIGGKNRFRHADKKVEGSQGRSVKDKTPVFGMAHHSGTVRTFVVPDTKAATLNPIIEQAVKAGSIIITDEWGAYNGLSGDYGHAVINHKSEEYVRGGFDTNRIEGFWSLLRRGIYGIYHQASPKHLQRYCHEFEYRYNSRKSECPVRFDRSLSNTANARITYKQLISKSDSI